MRENKQAQGAGADRVSQGMSHAFGRNIGRAVRVRPGQKFISVLVDEEHVDIAKQALRRANSRIGTKLSVRIGTDVESIGTRPKKTRDIIKEEKKVEEEKKVAEEEGKEAGEKGKPAEGKEAGKGKEKNDGKKEEKKPEGKEAGKKEAKKK